MISARWPKLKEHGLTGTRGSRLTIVGGGVMGLMTAYYAASLAAAVTVLDKSRVGDPGTASFGLTRSVRNDYLDPQYSRLAFVTRRVGRACGACPGPALAGRFPQFAADGGWLDVDAGFADVAAVTSLLRSVLPARGVKFREEAPSQAITRYGGTS